MKGALLAHYNFYNSIGEVIRDESGNLKWAINGSDHLNTTKNVDFLDQRGLYSIVADNYIKSPPNTYETSSVVVGDDFTVM